MPFYPGPGIGGHCIPVDPHYMSWKVRLTGYETQFIALADRINRAMTEHVVTVLAEALNGRGRAVRGASILVLGVTYKPDVNDIRESTAVEPGRRVQPDSSCKDRACKLAPVEGRSAWPPRRAGICAPCCANTRAASRSP